MLRTPKPLQYCQIRTLYKYGFSFCSACILAVIPSWPANALPTVQSIAHSSPIVAQATASSDDQIKTIVEEAVGAMANGNFVQVGRLAREDVRAGLTAGSISRSWADIQKVVGPFEEVDSIRVVDALGFKVAIATLEFGKGPQELTFIFDENQQLVAIELPDEGLPIDAIANNFVDALSFREFGTARSYLHPKLKVELTPQAIEAQWNTLQERTGRFRVRRNTRVQPGDEFDIVLIRLEFERFFEDAVFVFDDNKRIVGVDLPES